jgi:competence ComEA-like helix-hairpin-helix protein
MATIPLRAYNREIEGLIDRGQIDEAVAHSLSILQTFPKHVTTYRLLGKAYLEIQRYSDASDIFQRILSSVPDDFVSNVGMSIIREDESNLDAAIWHMERAFEAQPANAAIQDELRRLYGRRDGMEPPKVRLTRAALARMYAKGHLYQQAIGELRAALAEDPQRTDLQVLLAQMYYAAGLKVDAVNTSSNLLKKLPFCLEANRILAGILPETDRAEDAQIYKQQTIAMDPYFQFATAGSITTDNIPDEAVMATKLAYEPGSSMLDKPGQPAWAASLGVQVADQPTEALPDWLAGEEEEISQIKSNAFVWDEAAEEEAPFVESSDEEKPIQDEEMIPDWMKEAGWQPSDETVVQEFEAAGAGKSDFDEELPDDEIVSAQIPEWLREIAPEGALDQPLGEEAIPEELPSWLQETPPGESDSVVTWLDSTQSEELADQTSLESEENETLFAAGSETEAQLPTMGEEEPSLPDFASQPGSLAEDIPDWLQEFAPEQEGKPAELEEMATLIQPPSGEDQELGITDFLKNVERPSSEEPLVEELEIMPTMEEIPDWLKDLEVGQQGQDFSKDETVISVKPVIDQELPEEEITPAQPEEEIPEWLGELKTEGMALEEQPLKSTEEPLLPGKEEPAAEIDFSDDEAALAWLEGLAAKQEITTDQVSALPEESELISEEEPVEMISETEPVEMPDWLREIEAEVESIPEAMEPIGAQADTVVTGEEVNLEDSEEALAWLEGLAAKQGVPEDQLVSQADERLESPPEWLVEEPEEVEAISAEIPTEAESEELPVWLLESVDQELPEEPTQVEEPEELELPVETTTVGEIDLADENAALAWLETLAAKQGVPEEQLTVPPEERLESPPEWLKTGIETEEAAVEEAPFEAEEPSVLEAEEEPLPDWLTKEVETTAFEAEPMVETPEVVEPSPEEAEKAEIPDWLKEVEEEAVEEPALEISAASLPEWLLESEDFQGEEKVSEEALEEMVAKAQAETIISKRPEISEKLDLNAASLSELENLPGIGFVLAQSILSYREINGPLTSVDELTNVNGITIETLVELRDLVEVEVPAVKKPIEERVVEPKDEDERMLVSARSAMLSDEINAATDQYDVLVKKGLYLPEIIQDLQESLYRQSTIFAVWQLLGDAYVRSDQLDAALDAYIKAEELLR